MKNKSIIYLLLLLLICNFSYISNARSFPDLSETEEAYISDILATEIMKGDDVGRFRPNSYLTKAEATTIVLKMNGYFNSYLSAPSTFSDVPVSHWASQTIGLASKLGLTKGDENNNFCPDKMVTGAEFITMCLRVLGVGELLDSTQRWPYAHMEFCQNEKILNKLSKSIYEPLTRIEAANIASQFLTSNIWEKNYITGLYEKTDKNIMSDKLSIDFYSNAIISNVDKNYHEIDILVMDEKDTYSKSLEDLDCLNTIDLDDFALGSIANVYIKNNDVIKIDMLDDLKSRVLNFQELVEFNYSSDTIRVKVENKIKKYSLCEEILTVTANGKTKTGTKSNMSSAKRLIQSITEDENFYDEENDEYLASISGKIILNEDDEIVSISLAAYKKLILIKSISSEKITGYSTSLHTCSGVKTTSLNLKNKEYTIVDSDGNEIDIEDLDKDDMLMYSYDDEPYSILLIDNVVTGKVTDSFEDEDYVTIDGEDYYRNTFFCSYLPEEDDKVTLYLDHSNNIIAWE